MRYNKSNKLRWMSFICSTLLFLTTAPTVNSGESNYYIKLNNLIKSQFKIKWKYQFGYYLILYEKVCSLNLCEVSLMYCFVRRGKNFKRLECHLFPFHQIHFWSSRGSHSLAVFNPIHTISSGNIIHPSIIHFLITN